MLQLLEVICLFSLTYKQSGTFINRHEIEKLVRMCLPHQVDNSLKPSNTIQLIM